MGAFSRHDEEEEGMRRRCLNRRGRRVRPPSKECELVERRAMDIELFSYWWLVDLDDEVDGGWWVATMRLFG